MPRNISVKCMTPMVTESGSRRSSLSRLGSPTMKTSSTATRLKRSATKKIGEK